MKRMVSIIVTLSIILSLSVTFAFALQVREDVTLCDIYEISSGVYYSYHCVRNGDPWYAIIFVPNDEDRDVTFDAREEGENAIYSLKIQRQNAAKSSDGINYVTKGFSSLNQAEVDYISDSLIGNEVTVMPRDSVQADLLADMRSRYGTEYDRVVCTNYTYSGVSSIEIHQDLIYRSYKVKSRLNFAAGTTLSAIALKVKGNVSITLSLLAIALGIVGEVAETYKTVDVYEVQAITGRHGTVNGGTYVYTSTNKFDIHRGVNELNNEIRAYIVDEGETTYVPSSTYFHSYTAQCDDVYAAYMG